MKYIGFMLLLCGSAANMEAQTASWDWLKNATQGGNAIAHAIAVDPTGNLLVSGTYTSASVTVGPATLTNTGETNVFVAKYDHAGNALWARTSAGEYNSTDFALATDPMGNTILTGWFEPDTFILGTDTLYRSLPEEIINAYVVKYDPSGNVLWARRPFSNGYAAGRGVATDSAGNIYVAGYLECWEDSANYIVFGTDTFYNDTFSAYSSDIFLVKYDPMGNVLWAHTYGGSGTDVGFSVATDGAGNVFLRGGTTSPTISFGAYTLVNNGGNMQFMAKIDGHGNTKWVTSSAPGVLGGGHCAADKAGNAYMMGTCEGDSLNLGGYVIYNDTPGNYVLFVAKLDSTGHVLWLNGLGYGGGIYGRVTGGGMVADTAGNLFATGQYYGYPDLVFGTDTLYDDTAGGNNNLFVVKYDATGHAAWATSAAGSGNYSSACIARDDSGGIYICGVYYGATMTAGAFSLPATDSNNTFMAKLGLPQNTLVPVVANGPGSLQVYPVPVTADLHVALTGAGYTGITVTDMTGKTVWSRTCVSTDTNIQAVIPTTGLAPGSYLVVATRNGQRDCKKVVVRP